MKHSRYWSRTTTKFASLCALVAGATFFQPSMAEELPAKGEPAKSDWLNNQGKPVETPKSDSWGAPAARAPTAEITNEVSPKPQDHSLIVKSNSSCYTVNFRTQHAEVLGCSKPLSVRYFKRDCESARLIESGNTIATPVCTNADQVTLQFYSTQESVVATLNIKRKTAGKSGLHVGYSVDSNVITPIGTGESKAQPDLVQPGDRVPKESPFNIDTSGIAWFEYENTTNYGFSDTSADQRNTSVFANFNLAIAKDRTKLNTVFQVGEIFSGRSKSGGAVGGPTVSNTSTSTTRNHDILQIRDIYLSHKLVDSLDVSAGLQPMTSDARGFIFNDHLASVQVMYETDLISGTLWFGQAAQPEVGSTGNTDQYFGFVGTLGLLSKLKHSLYVVHRHYTGEKFAIDDGTGTFTEADAVTNSYWLGTTFSFEDVGPFGIQLTAIANWNNADVKDNKRDESFGHLLDAKVEYSPIKHFRLTGEYLMTSGKENSTQTIGSNTDYELDKREAFNSPINFAYLFTIATSDGVDDAPGTPKSEVFGTLSTPEGIQIAAATLSYDGGRKITSFLRYGFLQTTDGSKEIGTEWDLGAVYQITPSAIFQLDLGMFSPGDYLPNREDATLIASKMKFSF